MVSTSDSLMEEARRRAATRGRETLVSVTHPLAQVPDPLELFAQPGAHDDLRALWYQPSKKDWVVGLGEARGFPGYGSSRFAQAKASFQRLVIDAIVESPIGGGPGPIALGGFRFDPGGESSAEWRAFGDGFMAVPSLCYSSSPEGAWVTENYVVTPDGDGGYTRCFPETGMAETVARTMKSPAPEGVEQGRWRASIIRALDAIRAGQMEKVVMARQLVKRFNSPPSQREVLNRLVNLDPDCTIFAFAKERSVFVGASPEPLVKVGGEEVECVCEAGSAPRGSTRAEDEEIGAALFSDSKERREHALVVKAVAEALEGLCSEVRWQDAPHLRKFRNIQHLTTDFQGLNPNGYHVLDFVERLHPTPSVAGAPRGRALAWIKEVEGMDRGWYAGPVGWMDASGKGAFTVAIRSALLLENQAILYAGAGIVEGSTPDKEYAETGLKLRTLLSALGLEGR